MSSTHPVAGVASPVTVTNSYSTAEALAAPAGTGAAPPTTFVSGNNLAVAQGASAAQASNPNAQSFSMSSAHTVAGVASPVTVTNSYSTAQALAAPAGTVAAPTTTFVSGNNLTVAQGAAAAQASNPNAQSFSMSSAHT